MASICKNEQKWALQKHCSCSKVKNQVIYGFHKNIGHIKHGLKKLERESQDFVDHISKLVIVEGNCVHFFSCHKLRRHEWDRVPGRLCPSKKKLSIIYKGIWIINIHTR